MSGLSAASRGPSTASRGPSAAASSSNEHKNGVYLCVYFLK